MMGKLADAWPMIALGAGSIAFILALHFATLFVERRKKSRRPEVLFEATESESVARVEKLLPSKGSEDVSSLMKIEPPPPSQDTETSDDDNHIPDNGFDWAIDVELIDPVSLNERDILAKLNFFPLAYDRRPSIRGKNLADGKWVYCGNRNSKPLDFGRLKYLVTLFSVVDKERLPTEADLENQLQVMQAEGDGIGRMTFCPRINSKTAVEHVHRIKAFHDEQKGINDSVCLYLVAPSGKPFGGKAIWDVMHCLGLEWGDMDLFHLKNEFFDGDDKLFSVWTSTHPGYFLPEEIAAGRSFADNLIFGFCLPRTANPDLIYGLMRKAINDAQSRLGGDILSKDGKAVDDDCIISKIRERVAFLTREGFAPGSSPALRMF